MMLKEDFRKYLAWQAELGTEEVVLPRPLPRRAPQAILRNAPASALPASGPPVFGSEPAAAVLTPSQLFQDLAKTLEGGEPQAAPSPEKPPKAVEARHFPVFLGLADYWEYLEKESVPLFGSASLVRSTGPGHASLALVGLEPGESDGAVGRVFQGAPGELLAKMMRAIHVDSQNLYLTTLVKAAAGKIWSRRELARLLPLLHIELDLAKPSLVLLLGEACAQAVLKTGKPMDELRSVFHEREGREYLVTYHPDELLRREDLKRKAWDDLRGLQKKMTESVPGP